MSTAWSPSSSHGGAGLPSQWTVDNATGALTIALTGATHGADYANALLIKNADAANILTMDSAGELVTYGRDTNAFPMIAWMPDQIPAPTGIAEIFGVYFPDRGLNAWFVDYDGSEVAQSISQPLDTNIAANFVKSWYDSTNGAAKFGRRGKTADGTVVQTVAPMAPPITSGALPTLTITSGTARQIALNRNAQTVTPFTGDATNNAATCKVELSPDNVTYSTLNTISIAAALNLAGAIDLSVDVLVPAGWYIKLTATHGTLGTTTYYS